MCTWRPPFAPAPPDHLRRGADAPLVFDIALLAAFSVDGIVCALWSLEQVHSRVRAAAGPMVGAVFVVGVGALSGFGIALGRIARSNSWDIVLAPRSLWGDIEHVLVRAPAPTAALTATTCLLLVIAHSVWSRVLSPSARA